MPNIFIKQYFIYFLSKLGIFPKVNARLKFIKKSNLPKTMEITLMQMTYAGSKKAQKFIKSYLDNSIKLVKQGENNNKEGPVLLCAVKNDLKRVKLQLEHHRNIGIGNFIYIDNMSYDGTFEYLNMQTDVTLYRVDVPYNSTIRMGWWYQAINREGFNKWYLMLDSDELFAYPYMENVKIQEYVDFLDHNNIKTTTTPLIDMYNKNRIFNSTSDNDIKAEYCYFDNHYFKKRGYFNWQIHGGPRYRIFSLKNELTKHSLLKADEETIICDHEIFPFSRNFDSSVNGFLLHYKFLKDDLEKYINIADKGHFSYGSSEYKTYIKHFSKNSDISFITDKSQKYNNSLDLLKINITDKNFFISMNNWVNNKK
ncbi:MAG: glycosyltransferase family 2 protein [Treponema sp.]|jgi:hypothetical protein|nr:glycosyltransferase family 2 protein [Treponema sp.]